MIKKLTSKDLNLLNDLAIQEFKKFPSRIRLLGEGPQLNVDRLRSLSFLKAVLVLLKKKGILKDCDELLEKLIQFEPNTKDI